jgi:enoyl-[acyl-carrier protein] reductase III
VAESAAQRVLAGKVALVTGASRGIGRAIALKLASAGCEVAAVYFNAHDRARSLCEEIAAMGGRCVAIAANVGNPESVAELFGEISRQFSRLDIVVSNAASGVLKPSMEMTLKHWRWCMETNALALNLIAQRAAPMMPRDGRIIAISSLGASFALPDYGFIGASKAALEALVRSLAMELGHAREIRVNAVSAAVVDTDALKAFGAREQMLAEFADRAALGPALTPEHVAGAVFLLCLPEAAMITGQTLVVDGGFSISG